VTRAPSISELQRVRAKLREIARCIDRADEARRDEYFALVALSNRLTPAGAAAMARLVKP
jgi:hypothetical protein